MILRCPCVAFFTGCLAWPSAVPDIAREHSHIVSVLQHISTVSIFLSAVTATTLQFSYQASHYFLFVLINTGWFASLALSTLSAVIALIGITWVHSP